MKANSSYGNSYLGRLKRALDKVHTMDCLYKDLKNILKQKDKPSVGQAQANLEIKNLEVPGGIGQIL